MTTVTTYTQARAEFASLCDEVTSTREPVIIRRRNAEDVALVSADELASLLETAHLLCRQHARHQDRAMRVMRVHGGDFLAVRAQPFLHHLDLVFLISSS